MAVSVNLMTPQAQFRAAADRIVRSWALVLAALVAGMLPLAVWTWRELRDVALAHEALEARYEPIRRLAGANRGLGAEAIALVQREQAVLELARNQPAAVLLAAIGEATADSRGAAYVERLTLTRELAPNSQTLGAGRLTLEVTSMLGYDPSRVVKLLDRPPFTAVKISSSETIDDGAVPRKKHVIQCEF